jgi:porin
MRRRVLTVLCLALAAGGAVPCLGQGPSPTYSGDLLTRSTSTGDWFGVRNDLAARGITLDANVTQVEQGVPSGGKSGAWEYGGRGDLVATVDTQKLGLWPGGFVNVELEGNWENSVNGYTGALMPVNTNQVLPLPTGNNVALPDLSFAQFVSHHLGFTIGKMQTMSNSDLNEFAHGKGDTQFFNLAFNINPVSVIVPYSTLAAGAIVLPTANPDAAILKLVVLSATGSASTSGFDNLDGAIFATEGRVRTGFFDLTGHQLLGGLYSNKTYTSLDQRIGFVIQNRALVPHDGAWALYYNFDHYLYEPTKGAGRGLGVFGRFGASNGDPIPAQYFFSAGVGGKGFLASRAHDQMGLGYYYIIVNNPTFQRPLLTQEFLRDEWGVEAYYDLALTPWLLLTPDVQVIGPSQKARLVDRRTTETIGTATVLGVRLQVVF